MVFGRKNLVARRSPTVAARWRRPAAGVARAALAWSRGALARPSGGARHQEASRRSTVIVRLKNGPGRTHTVLRGLGARQYIVAEGEPSTPTLNSLRIDSKGARLIDAKLAGGGTQNHLRPLDKSLGLSSCAGKSLDDCPLLHRQLDLRACCAKVTSKGGDGLRLVHEDGSAEGLTDARLKITRWRPLAPQKRAGAKHVGSDRQHWGGSSIPGPGIALPQGLHR